MGTQVTCDLCRVVLKPGNRSPQRPRLIGLVPATSSGPFDEGIDDGSNDVELDLDVCKGCLRRVVGMIRECFGSTCAPEFIESSAKFLVDTQDAQDAQRATACRHQLTVQGKNMPLRWGTHTTRVCQQCGDFRVVGHNGVVITGWRPAAEYAAATAELNDDE